MLCARFIALVVIPPLDNTTKALITVSSRARLRCRLVLWHHKFDRISISNISVVRRNDTLVCIFQCALRTRRLYTRMARKCNFQIQGGSRKDMDGKDLADHACASVG